MYVYNLYVKLIGYILFKYVTLCELLFGKSVEKETYLKMFIIRFRFTPSVFAMLAVFAFHPVMAMSKVTYMPMPRAIASLGPELYSKRVITLTCLKKSNL